MAPAGKIAFIDTEARRGLHYAEEFDFLHSDMRPPFRPAAFIEGIHAAEAAGAEVVIIDSFSHEYDGQGGITEWADELEQAGTKSPGNWKIPKRAHKTLMNALLQCRASIIFCLRADEKIRIARENGKTVVEPLGWMPICEKRFMFEMTASFTLTPDRPGIPHFDLPHKLQRQHRGMFTDTKPIGEDSGIALAEWARGGAPAPTVAQFKPTEPADETTDDLMAWDSKLATAALQGTDSLRETWNTVPKPLKKTLEAALRNRHQPLATEADAKAPA
jgi:hypothetical protein